ncbi:YTP1 [Fusarium albosuccineum]|uniref:YTP1 n=1 Tax=Fusarium albosuccineum TaxID=1237068 RepID=A0A8H4PAJ3_9HYPO|nr:YTP1 [Fusarium albosuccineum]
MISAKALSRTSAALVLALLPVVLAHGDDHERDGDMGHGTDKPQDDSEYPDTYFSHPDHVGVIHAHIALMVLSWVFVLPVAVVLSLARSRFTLPAQFVFLATNAVGLVLGVVYNAQTPDLYPNNAHHKIGWIATWVVSAQVLVSAVGWVAGALRGNDKKLGSERDAFLPVPTDAHGFRVHHDFHTDNPYRLSGDSGHGTEPNTASLRSNSVSTLGGMDESPLGSPRKEYEEDDGDLETMSLSSPTPKGTFARHASKVVASRVWKYLDIGRQVVDRIILPFGFVALATGVVTFGRFFEGQEIFNGLAHWIKGGVFFWLGLFTLGRWSGSFGELGWAWNVRPQKNSRKWRPSAEFVESFLIFFYGSTNIFLEHLSGWGGDWTAQDMEHISITVLFLGGGLCGMLVESSRVRDLLNTTVQDVEPKHPYSDEEADEQEPPETYEFSLNPIPALVILLLGIMMSSHTQHTMISSMVHKQWGNLLLGASLTRGLTYVLMFLKPPKSVLPSRPPTELLAAFGLISGGIIFMASSGDTVQGMIHYDLDAMFMYTVTMGLVGLLMAWVVIVLAIKGWAVRLERRRASH